MTKQVKKKKPSASKTESDKNNFLSFLWEKRQAIEIGILFLAAVTIHLLIYYLYPTPNVNGDSLHYLDCATAHDMDVYRPYGYSFALILMQYFSQGTYIVFFFQFLLHFISSIFFLYTIKFLFKPARRLDHFLFMVFSVGVLFSPAVLYLSNYIISDSLFISLTLLWVTTLIRIMYTGNLWIILFHLIVLFAIIEVRYTGLFYPLFSTVIIAYVYRKKVRIAFALLPLLILLYVYYSVSSGMYRKGKTRVFSAFSGWQSANNALHIIPYIDLKPGQIKDPELRRIHMAALETSDSVYIRQGITPAYMWDASLPLKKYFFRYMDQHLTGYMISWTKTSVSLDQYGKLLMIKYPGQYIRHFILPNAGIVFYPYNTEMLEEAIILKENNGWFVQNTSDYKAPENDLYKKYYFPVLPELVLALWICLALCLVYLGFNYKKYNLNPLQKESILFMLTFMLTYTAFHIYAAPAAIRYMLGIHALQLAMIYIVLARGRGMETEVNP